MPHTDTVFSIVPRKSDEPLHILAHPSQILLWACDAAGSFEFFSPSWLAFTGRQLAGELGRGWLDQVYPDDHPGLVSTLTHALHEGSNYACKFRLLRRDGSYGWLAMEGMARRGADGVFAGFMGFCLEISPFGDGEYSADLNSRRIADLLRQTHLLALALDPDGSIQFANRRLCDLVGMPEEDLRNQPFLTYFNPKLSRGELARLFADGYPSVPPVLETLIGNEEQSRLIFWHSLVMRGFDGDLASIVLIGEDITERRMMEEKLLLTAKVFETTDQAMVITDAQCRILSVNGAFTRLTGYNSEDILGQNPRILQSGRHDAEFYRRLWDVLLETGHWHGDIWDRRKNGSVYPKFLSISAVPDTAGNTSHYCGIFYDITARKEIEEKLDRLAHYDHLTNLPNRAMLRDCLEQAISKARRCGQRVALLYIDLDRFKQINDTLGHHAGDELLKEVARRMKASVRAYDTVARIGGDEFVVVLPDIQEIDSVAVVARKIIDALDHPVSIEGQAVVSTPSIGISIFPDDHHDIEVLMRNADQAMYRAKSAGRRGFRFYGRQEAWRP